MEILKKYAKWVALIMEGRPEDNSSSECDDEDVDEDKGPPMPITDSVRAEFRTFCHAYKRATHQKIPDEAQISMCPVSNSHHSASIYLF